MLLCGLLLDELLVKISILMSFLVNVQPLSALRPVKLTYKYASEEKLAAERFLYSNGIEYYKHAIFDNFKDAGLSKKNCLVLTNVLNLNKIFENSSVNLQFGQIAGCVFLKTQEGKYITTNNNRVYVGGIGSNLFLNLIPNEDGSVYLKYGKTKFMEFVDQYPYDLKISDETIVEEQLYTRKFYIDYTNRKASFKVLTQEGYRFVSFGVDRIVRAIGLELNDTIVNEYFFDVEFITDPTLNYNFDAKTKQVQYFNEFDSFNTRKTVDVKQQSIKDTNLIVSCPTTQINLSSNEVNVNIALTKTNFTSFGTYNLS